MKKLLKPAKKAAGKSAKEGQAGKSNRKLVVFASLVGTLGLTSALLLALAPAPLVPDAVTSLFAVDTPSSLDVIFKTDVASATPGRWQYIYIHHSQTTAGNASTLSAGGEGLGDHFVIGNGDGAIDGEIQIGHRWNRQMPALPPAGASIINSSCISICVVGNFDETVPTATQQRRLAQLVGTLQSRLRIRASHIVFGDQPDTVASVGSNFPTQAIRRSLLP